MIGGPSSPDRKAEKPSAKGDPKHVGKVKDIFQLAEEFKEMVTQMAFEKSDFHQWFRCVSKGGWNVLPLFAKQVHTIMPKNGFERLPVS